MFTLYSLYSIWNQWRATWYLFVFVCCLGTWFHRGEDPPRHPWKSSSLPALFTGRISTLSEKHCSRRCWASGRTDFNRLQPTSTCFLRYSNFQFADCRGLPWFASDWRSLSAARLQDVKAQIFEGLRRLRVEIPNCVTGVVLAQPLFLALTRVLSMIFKCSFWLQALSFAPGSLIIIESMAIKLPCMVLMLPLIALLIFH